MFETRAIIEALAAGTINVSEARARLADLGRGAIDESWGDWLRRLVADELGVSAADVPTERNFTALGLSSKGALRLVGRVSARVGASVPVTAIFEHTSIAALAAFLAGEYGTCSSEAVAANAALQSEQTVTPDPGRVPLSEGQRGLWALHSNAPESSAYNLPFGLWVDGPLDVGRLQSALRAVVARHRILCATVIEEGGEPALALRGPDHVDVTVEDGAHWSEDAALERARTLARAPFALERGPLVRVHVLSRGDRRSLLLVVVHHLVFDGRSLAPFVSELFAAYRTGTPFDAANGERALYPEFVTIEQDLLLGDEGARRRSYWEARACEDWTATRLSPDRATAPQGREQKRTSAARSFPLPDELARCAEALTRSLGVFPSSLFLSVYQIALSQLTGEREVVVGVAVDQRPDARFSQSIGFFVTMVPVRSCRTEGMTISNFLTANQGVTFEALSHALPYPIVLRALTRAERTSRAASTGFRCAFAFQEGLAIDVASIAPPGLRFEVATEIHQEGEFELVCEVHQSHEGTLIRTKFDAEAFDVSTIERFERRFVAVLKYAVDHPTAPLSEIPILLDEERRLTLHDWNRRPRVFPPSGTIPQIFAERVAAQPDDIALVCGERRLSYREVWRRVRALARYLRGRDIGRDTLVAIGMDRSIEMVVAVLGVLTSGAAYVPFAPECPASRLQAMQADSQARIVLTHGRTTAMFRELLGASVEVVDVGRDGCIDAAVPSAEEPLDFLPNDDDLAYVIFTSGSTGKPKGVMVEHRHVVNTLRFMQEEYPVGRDDAYLLKAHFSFDISLTELCSWFVGCGRLVIAPPQSEMMPEALVEIIARERVTHVNFVPTMFAAFLEYSKERPEFLARCPLKYILVGGEAFDKALVAEGVRAFPRARVENLYGPTEVAIVSTFFPASSKPVVSPFTPIGHPIANATLYVLDSSRRALPIGRTGELYIGGAGVGRGYLRNESLTAERFIDNPFEPGTRLYRTGDLVRWLGDGAMEYCGRLDHQVKIRGYRVELGEIESALKGDPSVEDCAVIDRGEEAHKQLVAFVVSADPDPGLHARLREHLRRTLPDYMVPQSFVGIPRIPLSPNGKIDRALLKTVDVPSRAEAKRASCAVETLIDGAVPNQSNQPEQAEILRVWREVLANEGLGVDDRLFEAGGNSLLAAKIASRLRTELRLTVGAADLVKHSTVRALCTALAAPVARRVAIASPQSDAAPVPSALPEYYDRSLAVIGVACRVPGAASPRELWRLLRDGRDALRFHTPEELAADGVSESIRRDPAFVPLRVELEDKDRFDPDFFGVSQRDAALMDPQLRQLLMHSWQAIEDAGYTPEEIPDTSVFMSASNGMYQALLPGGSLPMENVLADAEKYVSWMFAQGGSIPATISFKLGLRGESLFIHSNCSSSMSGLSLAFQSIMTGQARCALVGGATIFPVSPKGYVYQKGMNFSRLGRCRPFDAEADGMVGGEGVAVVLVKRASDAVRDGDHVYGVIRGIAVNNDGADKAGFYAPSLAGQTAVIERALARSGVSPDSIGYVEAHGTGTKLGDPLEIAALSAAFRRHTDRRRFCGIGSIKSNLGHLDTAAGLAGCIKALLSLNHRAIPPSLHYASPNPELGLPDSPFFVVDALTPWPSGSTPRRAAVSSFGIGGTNAHAILEEAAVSDDAPISDADVPVVVPLSAATPDVLLAQAGRLLEFLRSGELDPTDRRVLVRIAYTLQTGRRAMAERVAFVVDSLPRLEGELSTFLSPSRSVRFRSDASARGLAALVEGDEDARELVARWVAKRNFEKIAKLWVEGVAIDWNLFYARKPRRMSLPTYPFRDAMVFRESLAPGRSALRTGVQEARMEPTLATGAVARLFRKQWTPGRLEGATLDGPSRIAILADVSDSALAGELRALLPGSEILTPSQLGVTSEPFDAVIDLLGYASCSVDPLGAIPFLQRVIEGARGRRLTTLAVTRGLGGAPGGAVSVAMAAIPAALHRSLQYEYGHIVSRHVDLDSDAREREHARQIVAELVANSEAPEVRYRRGERQVAVLEELGVSDAQASPRFPADRVLLITGGTGRLGRLCARHAVTAWGAVKLVLAGRERIPPRAEWDGVRPETALGEKIRSVRELERLGAEVETAVVDLGDPASVKAFVQEIRGKLGPIGGVLHAAGAAERTNPAFIRKSPEEFARVWAPKVHGLVHLWESVAPDSPAFFTTFSSVSAALPTLAVGQLDYAVANAFMDAFAASHADGGDRCHPIVSVQWPSWQTGGAEAATKAYRDTGLGYLSDEQGLAFLDEIIARRLTGVVLPAVVDPDRWSPAHVAPRRATRPDAVAPAVRPSSEGPARALDVPRQGLLPAVERWLLDLFAAELRMPPGTIEKEVTFDHYGVDSILIAQVVAKMERGASGLNLNPSLVLEHPSVALLSAHLVQAHGERLGGLLTGGAESGAACAPARPEAKRVEVVRESKDHRARGADGERIAIVGVACHLPQAPTLADFWSNLREGRDSVRPVPPSRWDSSKYLDTSGVLPGKTLCDRGGFIDDIESFDPGYFEISESLARQTDPLQRQWLEVSMEALADAGYGRRSLAGRSVGVFAGSKAGTFSRKLSQRTKDTALGVGQNFISAYLAHFCDFRGPNMVIDTACASALTAVHLACQSLSSGESEVALAGGVDILLDEEAFIAMSAARVLAPDGRCKTFSEAADGIGVGEGCGVVVLKPLARAIEDGNKIYGVLEASAINNDGHTMGVTTPNPEVQRALIDSAIRRAGVDPRSITYCEAHGTGTSIGDPIELKALTQVFSEATSDRQFCGVGSVKTNIGHLLNASGIASLIKVLSSVVQRELPPSLHCDTPNPRFNFEDSPFYVVQTLRPWTGHEGVLRAGVSSFGFGGHNAHVIVSDQGVPAELRADFAPRAAMPVFRRRRFWPDHLLTAPSTNGSAKRNGHAGPASAVTFEDEDALAFLQRPAARAAEG